MNNKEYSTRGIQVILDSYGINPFKLDDISYMQQLGVSAINKSGATLLKVATEKFDPIGCTLLFLLAESHLSFHCSPEYGFLSCDMYTCGDADPNIAVDYIIEQLQPDPNRIYRQTIIRGVE